MNAPPVASRNALQSAVESHEDIVSPQNAKALRRAYGGFRPNDTATNQLPQTYPSQ
jgi:hypothetical protein